MCLWAEMRVVIAKVGCDLGVVLDFGSFTVGVHGLRAHFVGQHLGKGHSEQCMPLSVSMGIDLKKCPFHPSPLSSVAP